jgi:hypothetical protein
LKKTSKPPVKKTSAKRDPLLKGAEPLPFDNLSKEEVVSLTDSQKVDKFLSRWMELIRPMTKYKRFFEASENEHGHNLRLVKNMFKHFCIDGDWSERKFVICLDGVLLSKPAISVKALEASEKLYMTENLPMQLFEKQQRRRGRRI